MSNSLNVFFTADEKFVKFFAVAITSLLENNSNLNLSCYLIHDIKDTAVLEELSSFLKHKYGLALTLVKIDSSLFDEYKIDLHISKASYYRLLLPEILPATVTSGLYLDCDTLVTGSLNELANMDLLNNYLFASYDLHEADEVKRLNDLGIPARRYFNAGVMLINLALWRKHDVSKKLIETATTYMQHLKWWDQDVLNIYFCNNWALFDSRYNSINFKGKINPTPIIIHYASPTKPWHYLNEHPYKALFWKYIKLTPYKNYTYEDYSFKEFLRKYYIYFLNALGLRK